MKRQAPPIETLRLISFAGECGATLRLAVPLAAAAFANSLLMVPLVFGVGLLGSVSMGTAQAARI